MVEGSSHFRRPDIDPQSEWDHGCNLELDLTTCIDEPHLDLFALNEGRTILLVLPHKERAWRVDNHVFVFGSLIANVAHGNFFLLFAVCDQPVARPSFLSSPYMAHENAFQQLLTKQMTSRFSFRVGRLVRDH